MVSFRRYSMPLEDPIGPRPMPKYNTTSWKLTSAGESALCFMGQPAKYNPEPSTRLKTRFGFPFCVVTRFCRSTILPFTDNRNGGVNLLRSVRKTVTQQSDRTLSRPVCPNKCSGRWADRAGMSSGSDARMVLVPGVQWVEVGHMTRLTLQRCVAYR